MPGFAHRFRVSHEVAVQQHRPLAAPRRPRGVGDHSQALATRHFQAVRLAEKIFEPGAGLDHRLQLGQVFARTFEFRLPLLVGKAQTYSCVAEDVPELAPAVLGVHGHNDAAGQVRPQVCGQEIWMVAEKECDPLAGAQPPGSETGAEALSPFAHALVGDLLPLEAQAELLGRPLGISYERLSDRSLAPLTRTHAFPSSILWPVRSK